MSLADSMILNIDDQHTVRCAKTSALQLAGFKVMEAASAIEGLDCVEKFRPALVICDGKMPGKSGFDVARAVKQRFPGTLVMQVSASFAPARDRAIDLEHAADSYLTEPIEPEELIASIRALLRLKEFENDLRAANARREFIFDLAERQRALDDPQEIMRRAAEMIGRRFVAKRVGFSEVQNPDTLNFLAFWTDGDLPVRNGAASISALGEKNLADHRAGRPIVADMFPGTGEPELRRACLGLPIRHGSKWQASMFIDASAEREWTPDEMSLAQEIALLTWDAVERARAMRRIVALNESLEERIAERTKELFDAEAQLRQAQKMEAVGQLTGGIAHDFNNLLTGIIGGVRVVRRRIQQGRLDEIDKFMDEVTNSAQRAAALVHRLLAFSRRQSLDFTEVNVRRLVRNIEDIFRRTIGEHITLRTELRDDLWSAETDAGQLETALLNLVINARDAMPDGGSLVISAENFTSGAPSTVNELEPGDYVMLRVRDTGVGMPDDVLLRVFDPFFTTKPIGQGTGLGLSMVYGFMKQARGHVEISSRPGNGTEIRLYLRRCTAAMNQAEKPDAVSVSEAHKGGTIVVVEDNTAVLMLVTDRLRELGYAVLAAADGNEAVAVLGAARTVDLLVTDVGLPGLNGRQVAEIAKQARPDLKIIFITGYAEAARIRSGFLPAGSEFLTKPFDVEDLAAKVGTMLAHR